MSTPSTPNISDKVSVEPIPFEAVDTAMIAKITAGVSAEVPVVETKGDEINTLEARPAVYSSRFISIDQDAVEFPNGVVGEYNVVNMTGKKGALIVPVAFHRGLAYFGLVEQYRYPVKQHTIEFPRGGAENLEKDGAETEIQEELGLPSKRLDLVGTMRPDTGILSTEVGVWIAVMPAEVLTLDHTEDITGLKPRWVQEGELIGLISSGKITCGMTLAAYTMFNINRNQYGALMR